MKHIKIENKIYFVMTFSTISFIYMCMKLHGLLSGFIEPFIADGSLVEIIISAIRYILGAAVICVWFSIMMEIDKWLNSKNNCTKGDNDAER